MSINRITDIGLTFRGCFVAGAAVCAAFGAFLTSAEEAHATNQQNVTCAQIDPSQGGAAQTLNDFFDLQATVAAGDRLLYTSSLGLPISGGGVTIQSGSFLDVSTATAGAISFGRPGGGAGTYTIQCIVGGATQANNSQQKALTNLVMTSQSNTMSDAVFGQIANSFNGGGAPQVSANGFSATTGGTVAWLNGKKQDKRATAVAELETKGDGTTGTYAVPVAGHFAPQSPWNAWIKGSYNHYDGDGNSFDGGTFDLLLGADYKVNPDVIVGAMVGYGNTDFDTNSNGASGSFDADGYTFGPYVGVRLTENLQWDALIAYTFSDYDTKSGTTSGDFDADRITFATQLTGTWNLEDGWFVSPSLRFVYAEEDQEAYTNSAGVRQGSVDVNAGRISLGPKIGRSIPMDDGSVLTPWGSVKGEYDFSNQGNVPASGLPDLDDILSARFSLGLDAQMTNGMSVSVEGSISGVGSSEYTGYGGSARIGIPF